MLYPWVGDAGRELSFYLLITQVNKSGKSRAIHGRPWGPASRTILSPHDMVFWANS